VEDNGENFRRDKSNKNEMGGEKKIHLRKEIKEERRK